MTAIQLMLPSTIVKKSNVICRARWKIESVFEPRLVALVAARVHKDDENFQEYNIKISELMDERTKGGDSYKRIEQITESLMSRVITIKEEGTKSFTKYTLFCRCRYIDEKNCINICFHPDLKPHFLGLNKKFTQYNLLEFLLLPSIYSQKMFELLKSWDDKPDVEITLEELHDIMDAPISLRKDFAGFRRRVLEKSHLDIIKNTSLYYEWEAIKKGRSVDKIKFIFGKKRIEESKNRSQKIKTDTNNKLYREAVNCFTKKSNSCQKMDNKKSVCKICQKIFVKVEV